MNKKKQKTKRKSSLPKFDKYEHYLDSVQDPIQTIRFLEKAYREAYHVEPVRLREDFCGTFMISCTWAERHPQRLAFGIDAAAEPLRYGRKHYWSRLKEDQKPRVQWFQENVLNPKLPKADIIAAVNFSYYVLKERKVLIQYFKQCRKALTAKGIFVLDCFGGTETTEPLEEETDYGDYIYYFDQVNFDPVNNGALYYIHFKRKGEKKRERVFRYDWRMWTIVELKECLKEAGFDDVSVYWEGTNSKGEGTGRFKKVNKEENCECWVAYVVAR